MKKPNLSLLAHIVDRATELGANRKKCGAEIEAILREKAAAMEAASGPDDKEALTKLTALASREVMMNTKIELIDRELKGLAANAQVEAQRACNAVNAALTVERERIRAALDAALAPFYEERKTRETVVSAIIEARSPLPFPSRVYQIRRAFIEPDTNHKSETPDLQWPKRVLAAAQRAEAILAAK